MRCGSAQAGFHYMIQTFKNFQVELTDDLLSKLSIAVDRLIRGHTLGLYYLKVIIIVNKGQTLAD